MKKLTRKQKTRNKIDLQDIISSLPGHVYWKDKEGVCLGCNKQQAIDAGLNSPEDIIGKTDYELPWKDKADQIRLNDLKVMQTGQPLTVHEANYLSHKSPLYDKNGNIAGVIGISINISEYQSELEKSWHTLDEIIAVLPGHVYWKNRDCVLQGCNNQQAKDVGLESRHDIVGKTAYDIIWQNQPEKDKREQAVITDAIDKEIMETNAPKGIEEFVIDENGNKIYYWSQKLPLHNNDGEVDGLVGISLDITELKNAEQELKTAKERAEQANKTKTEFLYNMRHDFRTPFTGILGMADLMERQETDPIKKQNLGYITQAAKCLLDQHNEIFELAALEDGHLPIREKQFDLYKVLNDIKSIMIPPAKDKQLEITFSVSSDVPKYIIGDRVRLHRILMNLISNSIKFTEEGSIKIFVAIGKKYNQNIVLKFKIQDTGIGIPKDKQSIIYERFTRLSSSYKGLYEGKGYGLHIVKDFTDQLNGEIHLRSEANKGTTFDIILPFKIPLLECAEEEL